MIPCDACRDDLLDLLPPLPPGVHPISGGTGIETAAAIAAVVTAVAGVAAAGISAYGAYQSSQYQSAALEYNAALAASQAQYQAAYAQGLAEFQARLLERQMEGVGALGEFEASLSEQQAIAAQASGEVRAAALRRNYNRTQSEVRAAIGTAGVDTTGSPLLVLLENADTVGQELALNDYQTALDVAGAKSGATFSRLEAAYRSQSLAGEAAMHRFGGGLTAQGLLSQGAASASMLNFQAGGVRRAGLFNVGTSLLGGVQAGASPFLRYGFARA